MMQKLSLAAAVVAVCALGNLRSEASEPSGSRPAIVASPPSTGSNLYERVAMATHDAGPDDVDTVDTALGDAESASPGQLVPAIYAWDPDVRFIYFRHVSKWM